MMKRSFLPSILLSFYLASFAQGALAASVTSSSEFTSAWNSGSSPISVSGEVLDTYGTTALVLGNALNSFSGPTMTLSGANGVPGIQTGSNVKYSHCHL